MLKATPRLRFPPPPRKKSFLAAKPRHAVIGLSAETEGCARTPLGSPYIWAPRRASPLLFVFTFFSPQKAAFAGGSQPDFHPLRVDEIVPLLLFGGSWTSSPPLQMQSNMPVHHEKRPLDPFSERFDACLAAYDHVGGDPAAKRAFHAQARRAVAQLAAEIGLGAGEARVQTIDGDDDDDGVTELRHPDIGIRVVPRSFLPDSEITFHRCRGGEPSSRVFCAPIAELLDAPAFARRLTLSIGALPPSLEAAA